MEKHTYLINGTDKYSVNSTFDEVMIHANELNISDITKTTGLCIPPMFDNCVMDLYTVKQFIKK